MRIASDAKAAAMLRSYCGDQIAHGFDYQLRLIQMNPVAALPGRNVADVAAQALVLR